MTAGTLADICLFNKVIVDIRFRRWCCPLVSHFALFKVYKRKREIERIAGIADREVANKKYNEMSRQ